ncbi:Calcineurin-like phosphoesterase superfamily domain protein [Roseovarius albus]|uniref:Calcineurin-like phosphoesterase superfamily domain protein n=1 Tax=Roseovarius albus TaxID=1247867 RepID=A0A1X6YHI4_9RHOB|nr:metallophosphoesterase family protein [Roseovarius albus]SLN21590.1 Calcineurin-like phosphoesterase superfamily domain protein [Roseovarius albus]
MKILAFSDLHHSSRHAVKLVEASKDADLVIGAGDFCNMRRGLPEALELLSGIAAPIIAVPGNGESADELTAAAPPNMLVLHGTGTAFEGLNIFGLGYGIPETPFGDWSCDLSEEAALDYLDQCQQADILILHSPPKGIADQTSIGQSVGSVALYEAIERLQPKLAVCGHIHDSWGQTGLIGSTKVVNLGPTTNWFDI